MLNIKGLEHSKHIIPPLPPSIYDTYTGLINERIMIYYDIVTQSSLLYNKNVDIKFSVHNTFLK
jgi:hypothetical protein